MTALTDGQVSARDVAKWMLEQFERHKILDQEVAVFQIRQKFGLDFVRTNRNGNLAIKPNVLSEFRKLTGDEVVWDRGERHWRKRRGYDKPGRQQE